jgi:hypothetical protein
MKTFYVLKQISNSDEVANYELSIGNLKAAKQSIIDDYGDIKKTRICDDRNNLLFDSEIKTNGKK